MIAIVIFTIVGVFGYFLLSDNLAYKQQLQRLNMEIEQQQKLQIRAEVKRAREYIDHIGNTAKLQLEQQSRDAVERAHAIANSIYQQQRDNTPAAEIQQNIKAALRNVRFFNGRGYHFILTRSAKTVMLPPVPKMETLPQEEYPAASKESLALLVESVNNPQGEGFSSYFWYSPTKTGTLLEKISFSKVFAPFNWIIGTGDYLYSFEQDLKDQALQRLRLLNSNPNTFISILNSQGQVLSQSAPSGDTLSDDKRNRILDFVRRGGGFMPRVQSTVKAEHTSITLVESIQHYDWVLVVEVYPEKIKQLLDAQRQQIERAAKDSLYLMLVVLLVTLVLTALASTLFSRRYRQLFQRYQEDIDSQHIELERNAYQLQIAAQVFQSANEGILVTDPARNIIAVNPACIQTTGYSEQELLGKNPSMLSSEHQDNKFYEEMWDKINRHGQWKGELWNQRKNGEIYPEWLSISSSVDEHGQVVNYVATFSDVSERKKNEQRLRYLADYDPLTELANRRLLADRVHEVISFCQRNQQQQFALMLIDLDRFKNINDSLGHNIGDRVLQQIAKRLSATVRASDTISRLGGDEFIILVNHHKAETASARLAGRILRELSHPLHIEDHDLVVTPSIGIALYPDNGEGFDSLLKNADAALHHAKAQGRNNYQYFTDDMNDRASQKLSIERGLRQALNNREFELYYQAQYELGSGKLCGCEALLRWRNPQEGMIAPDIFIPVAEETGLIRPIGQWVLEQACKQAKRWQEQGIPPIAIAVNFSSYQFRKDIVQSIVQCTETIGLDPHWLVIEVTESALMQDPNFTRQALSELRERGFKIALDDFGTGYSSLAYLKRFPIDKLKIDRTFIDGLPRDQDDSVITRSIIDVARNLNMTTIAEGVETDEQHAFLTQIGCQQMQGYLKAKPLPAETFYTDVLADTASS
ncbi:MAG: bifunctional diguanylate cyclase/phosphodiesterase [Pseudomonadales bacterium]